MDEINTLREQSLRKLCRVVLSRRFVIDEADTALSAFEKIINDRPWGVVLDIRMPGRMTGWDVCRYLKRDAQYRNTKVVIVSGSVALNNHQLGDEFGPDAIFEKPFQAEAILRFLEGECGL